MTRKRTIGLAAIALLTAFALIDIVTHRDPVFPATVIGVVEEQRSNGAAHWFLDIALPEDETFRIKYYSLRPNRTRGERVCVQKSKRGLFGTSYQVTAQINC